MSRLNIQDINKFSMTLDLSASLTTFDKLSRSSAVFSAYKIIQIKLKHMQLQLNFNFNFNFKLKHDKIPSLKPSTYHFNHTGQIVLSR